MPSYLFHLYFCLLVSLSIWVWSCLAQSIKESRSKPLFLMPFRLWGPGSPLFPFHPLHSPANAHGADGPFIIPSKLSLFPFSVFYYFSCVIKN